MTQPRLRAQPGRTSLRTLALIGLPLTMGGMLLALARPDRAQQRPAETSDAPPPAPSNPEGSTRPAPTAQSSIAADDDAAERRLPESFYTREVRGNLFSAPVPPAPKAPPPPKPAPKPKPVSLPKVVVMPVNPFASWAYTGTVRMGDQIMALLENAQTKEGQYIRVGETFQGAQVLSITDDSVTLTLGGKPNVLAKSNNIVLTPLNAPPAPAGTPPPGQPGGPPPAQPALPPAPQMNPQPGTVILPNGRVLTGAQAARRAQRLNANFDAGKK